MLSRLTERARQVVFQAQVEAQTLGSSRVGPEHLALAILRNDSSVASMLLAKLGVDRAALLALAIGRIEYSDSEQSGDMQLTDDSKHVLDLAGDEAASSSNNYCGTEHLLLALVRLELEPTRSLFLEAGVEAEALRSVLTAMQCGEGLAVVDRPVPDPRRPSEEAARQGTRRMVEGLLKTAVDGGASSLHIEFSDTADSFSSKLENFHAFFMLPISHKPAVRRYFSDWAEFCVVRQLPATSARLSWRYEGSDYDLRFGEESKGAVRIEIMKC